jgi:hypothetical protein
MNNINFGKRIMPQLKLSKIIYIFYDDLELFHNLQYIANKLSNTHNYWLFKYYIYNSPITSDKILHQINTPYHKYDRRLDKLCVINNNNSFPIKNTKFTIEYFSNISCFELWLNKLKIS